MNPSGLADPPDLAGALTESGGPSRRRSHESKAGLTKTQTIEEAEKATKSMSTHFFWKKLHPELGFAISATVAAATAAAGEPSLSWEIRCRRRSRVGSFVGGGAPAITGGAPAAGRPRGVAAAVGVARRVGPGRGWSRFEGDFGLGWLNSCGLLEIGI